MHITRLTTIASRQHYLLLFVCIAFLIVVSTAVAEDKDNLRKDTGPTLVPVVELPWKQVAHNPELPEIGSKAGAIVDHCFFQAADGHWELWTQIRGTAKGRLFYRWEGGRQFDRPG
ncbi:MAG: hypothetical protein JXM70_14530, partial [Pirellulales bacterium]|nr:hypothetical protein [Pirellulales bacterium]